MNKIIEEELSKVCLADLSQFNPSTNTYHIPKYTKIKPQKGGFYIIELSNYILDNNTGHLLAINWNKGKYPTNKHMKVEVIDIKGPYIQVNGIGYDKQTETTLNNIWSGWLPIEKINILVEL